MALVANDRSMGPFDWQESGERALPKPETSPDNTIWQACLLAMVAGYADAVGFLTFNAFAGAMTGNTVLLGIALAGKKLADVAQSAGIIAAFLVGVAASAWLRRWVSLAGLVFLEMAAILLAALVTPLVAAHLLALAMGLQNAAMTQFAGTTLNTVFLTGNLQKLVQDLLRRDRRESAAGRATIALIARFWLAYLAGVVLGAVAWHAFSHPLLFAVLPLPLVLLRRATWRAGCEERMSL
jgi:uncharacterized membrane protein YoaK (UPF0700 family)